MKNLKHKIWIFFSSLLNMVSKKRVERNIIEGRHFTNDIKWIKRKHLFRYSLDPNDRILTIRVKNTLDVTKQVKLFAATMDPYNRYNPGIEIDVLENSYEALKASLLSTTFFIDKIKLIVKDRKQLLNPTRLESHGFCGSISARIFLPINFISARQEYREMVELSAPNILLKLNKSIVYSFELNPKEEMTFVLYSFAIKSGDELYFNLAKKYSEQSTCYDNILNPL